MIWISVYLHADFHKSDINIAGDKCKVNKLNQLSCNRYTKLFWLIKSFVILKINIRNA